MVWVELCTTTFLHKYSSEDYRSRNGHGVLILWTIMCDTNSDMSFSCLSSFHLFNISLMLTHVKPLSWVLYESPAGIYVIQWQVDEKWKSAIFVWSTYIWAWKRTTDMGSHQWWYVWGFLFWCHAVGFQQWKGPWGSVPPPHFSRFLGQHPCISTHNS